MSRRLLHPLSRSGRRTARPRLAAPALVLAASLALAGCGGSDSDSEKSPEAQGTATGSTLSGQWPFTGLPASGDAPAHPPFVVKIDNSPNSNPQIGLGSADLVTQELVEGGSTRLAVFYYSTLPDRVGPVRSMRSTDIGIVQPADAVLVASGGAGPTVQRMKAAGIKVVSEGGKGYSRDSSRSAPYNLFMDLPTLAKTMKDDQPPANYFTWGDEKSFPGGQRASTVVTTFSPSQSTRWKYTKKGYVNQNSQAKAGDDFLPSTVLVLRVKVGTAGYKDPAGNPVPETRLSGTGSAMVFHGGSMTRATWSKKGLAAPIKLRTKGGELALPPGKVWVELVPVNGGNVTANR